MKIQDHVHHQGTKTRREKRAFAGAVKMRESGWRWNRGPERPASVFAGGYPDFVRREGGGVFVRAHGETCGGGGVGCGFRRQDLMRSCLGPGFPFFRGHYGLPAGSYRGFPIVCPVPAGTLGDVPIERTPDR